MNIVKVSNVQKHINHTGANLPTPLATHRPSGHLPLLCQGRARRDRCDRRQVVAGVAALAGDMGVESLLGAVVL